MPECLDELLKLHDWDLLVFGGALCLHCTPEAAYMDDPDLTVMWPCPPLREAGLTDERAEQIVNDRLFPPRLFPPRLFPPRAVSA